jgi:hypothetical protein
MFSDVDEVKERMRGMPDSPTSDDELEKEAHAVVEFANSGNYDINVDHQKVIGMAMKMALTVAPIFTGRD